MLSFAVTTTVKLTRCGLQELYTYAKDLRAPFHLLKETARLKRLPVVLFAAGGIATPADAALMMQMGMDGVFVGSGIVRTTLHYRLCVTWTDSCI